MEVNTKCKKSYSFADMAQFTILYLKKEEKKMGSKKLWNFNGLDVKMWGDSLQKIIISSGQVQK